SQHEAAECCKQRGHMSLTVIAAIENDCFTIPSVGWVNSQDPLQSRPVNRLNPPRCLLEPHWSKNPDKRFCYNFIEVLTAISRQAAKHAAMHRLTPWQFVIAGMLVGAVMLGAGVVIDALLSLW